MGHLSVGIRAVSAPSLALHCDEYELTMADSFARHHQADDRVTFELSVRHLPATVGAWSWPGWPRSWTT